MKKNPVSLSLLQRAASNSWQKWGWNAMFLAVGGIIFSTATFLFFQWWVKGAGLDIVFWSLAVAALALFLACFCLLGWMYTRWHEEQTRKELNSLLVEVYDGSFVAHCITDHKDHIVYANAALKKFLREENARHLDQIAQFIAGDDLSLNRFYTLRQNLKKNIPSSIELHRLDRQASSKCLLLSARLLPGRHAHYVHWRIEDVTARREMEALLRDEQLRLIDFMNNAPVGFYSINEEGKFIYVNKTLAGWFGKPAEELVNTPCHLQDFIKNPNHITQPHANFDCNIEQIESAELTLESSDGTEIPVAITQVIVSDRERQSISTRSVVQDLRPERSMRQALQLSEGRFRQLFQDAPIGIALLDRNGHLKEWNASFDQLVGQDLTLFRNRPFVELLSEPQRQEVRETFRAIAKKNCESAPFDIEMLTEKNQPNQTSNTLSITLYARYLDHITDPGLIIQLIDRTEQRNLEQQFIQSQKMQAIGQLAGGIAHDFNNLLTAMNGYCDLLLIRHKIGDPSFSDIMQVKQNVNRAANLVRQLLAFSRQQTMQPKIIDITDALSDLSYLLRRLIGENIELKMIHGRNLGLVKVDQGQLEQVIINLVVNARDAIEEGGIITIRSANITNPQTKGLPGEKILPGVYTSITVEDTGSGMTPDVIEHIFEPFFSTKQVGAGTGLGLSTVYGIIRQTGGYIAVDSKPGGGSKFSIYLPQEQNQEKQDHKSRKVEERKFVDLTGQGSILFVEDEEAVRAFAVRALRSKGYRVLEAASGEDALDILRDSKNRIDLLISDIVMPMMDGPTLVQHAKILRPDLKVIFISGYTEDRLRDNIDKGEPINYLQKPFSLQQLASAVKEEIGGVKQKVG